MAFIPSIYALRLKWQKNQLSSQKTGQLAEKEALYFLKKQGLQLIKKNFISYFGEIDLIMQDKSILTFIEVRYQKNGTGLSTLESIDQKKQHHLKNTAYYFLSRYPQYQNHMMRFDALGLTLIKTHYRFLPNMHYHWAKGTVFD